MARKKNDTVTEDMTWSALNDTLREADEETCAKMLEEERTGKKRVNFMLRIYSRYSVLRAQRERDLVASAQKI